MSKDSLNKVPMYDGMFFVFVTVEEFYQRAYEETTTILALTDDFINNILGSENVEGCVSDILAVRNDLDIVLIGKQVEFDIANTFTIREDWVSPTRVSSVLMTLHNRERTLSTNHNDVLYRDFRLNSVNSEDMVSYILSNPKNSMEFMNTLLDQYHKSTLDKWSLSNKMSSLQLENQSLNEKVVAYEKQLNLAIDRNQVLIDRYNELIAKINYQYSIPYEDIGNSGFAPEVISYRKVLYIKEISPVKYTQSLIYYIQQIMNTLNSSHTRCLVIERPGAFQMANNLFSNFVPHNRLTHGDLKYSDIIMVGYQKDIMSSIILNTAQHEYLIIWDRTGSDNIYLRNDKVKPVYTMSDLQDNFNYQYPLSNILSYSSQSLHINYIDDFDNMSAQDKIRYYSEMDTVKKLIHTLEV
jgi:hypothetical protein